MGFWDFDEYERLLAAATRIGPNAGVIVLLGGDADPESVPPPGGPLLDLDGRCLGMNIARANRAEGHDRGSTTGTGAAARSRARSA